MIASQIGLNFLIEYNKIHGTEYTAQSFFKEIFAPLFFDHEKYMRTGGNAPLDNPKIKKGTYPNTQERAERISKTIDLIEADPLGSSGIGYPSKDILATTSGMVTNLNLQVTSERIYAAWIGSGLSIGVDSSYSIFIDNPKIFMILYEGWTYYRHNYLNNKAYKNLKGNQIDKWNAQWLTHRLNPDFMKEHPFLDFDPFPKEKGNVLMLDEVRWLKVFFSLSQLFPNSTITGYVYKLDKSNKTVGFIPFILPQINKPIHLYKKLFGENEYLKNSKQIESIYGSELSFIKCCEMGSIGIKALEPQGLKNYIFPTKDGDVKYPNYKKIDDNQKISFNTYITWILAMINNESLLEKADAYAQAFIDYEGGAQRAKVDRANDVKKALTASKREFFIENLIPIVEKSDKKPEALNELVVEINKIPVDNFSYFLTLIRFRYAYLKK